jgi:Ca2+/Na+ antiporter|eukprot:COSAG02_NODE_317_length_24808_cov_120.564329_3_plen_228_part_00
MCRSRRLLWRNYLGSPALFSFFDRLSCHRMFALFYAWIKNAYIEAGTRPPILVLPSAGSGTPRWVALVSLCVSLLVSIGMAIFLQASNRCTERGVPAFVRWGYCITSFIACLAWIDLLAEEAVALLESVGFLLNIPLTMIGLTALAWGNCVPDGFAAFLLARRDGAASEKSDGDADGGAGAGSTTAMAISGCFGAPIFNITVVLSVRITVCRPVASHYYVKNLVLCR